MSIEDRRQDSQRLRAVEEAIIEFRVIAKTVVVDHSKRLDEHDDDIAELKTAIYQSCDAKSKEVDIKDEKLKNDIFKVIAVVCAIGLGLAGLGLAAVIYFNNGQSELQTDLASIHTTQDYMCKQIDKLVDKK